MPPSVATEVARPAAALAARRLAWVASLGLLVAATLWIYFAHLTDRPAGFYLDESFNAYNAWTLSQDATDEHGTPWPLVIRYPDGDSKSALYTYLLAGVFKVTGPSVLAARALSAVLGTVTALLLGLLAWRVTRRAEIALLTGATVVLTPWTFEISRLVFDAALVPPLVAGLLLAIHVRSPSTDARISSSVITAFLLAAITYSYHLGRLLGPLLAVGLLLFARRDTWRGIARTWLMYALLLLPYALYELSHPGALSSRLQETGYLNGPLPDVVATFAHQLVRNMDPARLLFVGDANERHHAPGIMGSLLLATAVLGVIGIDRAVHSAPGNPWPRFLLFGLVASFIPAALTRDEFHSMRLAAVPVFVIALGIQAQQWLVEHGRASRIGNAVVAALAVATIVQGVWFQLRYADVAPLRGHWFDEPYEDLLATALSTGEAPIYLEDGIVPGYIHGLWFAATRGIGPDRFVHLAPGQHAPPGALVLSSVTDCSPCDELAAGGFFRLYRPR